MKIKRNTVRYTSNPLPEMSIGSWITENKQGIFGGLKTAAGIGAMLVPGLQSAGVGLIGSGVSDIGNNVITNKTDIATSALETQNNIYNQQMGLLEPQQTDQFLKCGGKLKKLKKGGFIEYDGQSHDGPNGGIPVDDRGNPTVISGAEPVASVEDGEVTYAPADGGTPYVFSKEFSERLKKIQNKYKLRLGKDFKGTDQLAQGGLSKEVNDLMVEQEAFNMKNNKQKEKTKMQSGGDIPIDPFKEALPFIGAQAGATVLGNLAMAAAYKKPEELKPTSISAPTISLESARQGATTAASAARSSFGERARRAGSSTGEYLSSLGSVEAGISSGLGQTLADTYLNEETTNKTAKFEADRMNASSKLQADSFNIQMKDQYRRGKLGMAASAIQGIQGGLQDTQRALSDRNYLDIFSARHGYQMVKDPVTKKRKLVPIEGHPLFQ